MKVFALWANGRWQEREIGTDLDSLKDEVGGWLEHLDLGRGIHAWFNEDGKLIGLPVNRLATELFHRLKAISQDDVMVGSVVFTGVDSNGDTCDCPQSFVDHAKKIYQF